MFVPNGILPLSLLHLTVLLELECASTRLGSGHAPQRLRHCSPSRPAANELPLLPQGPPPGPHGERRRTDLGQGALHAVARDDDAVPLVRAPALEELPGQPALHHARGRHHHAGPDVVKVVHALGREGESGQHQAGTELSLFLTNNKKATTRAKGS